MDFRIHKYNDNTYDLIIPQVNEDVVILHNVDLKSITQHISHICKLWITQEQLTGYK